MLGFLISNRNRLYDSICIYVCVYGCVNKTRDESSYCVNCKPKHIVACVYNKSNISVTLRKFVIKIEKMIQKKSGKSRRRSQTARIKGREKCRQIEKDCLHCMCVCGAYQITIQREFVIGNKCGYIIKWNTIRAKQAASATIMFVSDWTRHSTGVPHYIHMNIFWSATIVQRQNNNNNNNNNSKANANHHPKLVISCICIFILQ